MKQKLSKNKIVIIGLVLLIILLLVISIIEGKTIWDFLELIIVPIVLAIVGYLISSSQRDIQDNIAKDNQRESSLQEYFNKMADLMLQHELKKSAPGDEVRALARTLTLTTLKRLDGERKGALLLFLKDAKLIKTPMDGETEFYPNPIVHSDNLDLSNVTLTDSFLQKTRLPWAKINNANFYLSNLNGSDFREADLSKARLTDAKLMQTDLRKAKLIGANLRGTKLFDSDLRNADLQDADLSNCDMNYAKLHGTNLSGAKLTGTNLNKATFTDATIWPKGFDPIQEGAILDTAYVVDKVDND